MTDHRSRIHPPRRLARRAASLSWTLGAALLLAQIAAAGGPKPQPNQAPARPPVNRKTFALKNVTVVDVAAGTEQHDMTVLIAGGKITGVGPTAKLRIPQGTRAIDVHGTFLIPGLWDFDVRAIDHAEDTFRLLVANGVTGVRDMDTTRSGAAIRDLRAAIARGTTVGPRLVTALDRIGGDNADAVRQAVREHKAAGADFINPGAALDAAAYKALVEEAAKVALPVGGAVPTAVGAADAAAAGQTTIDGLESIFRATSTRGSDLPTRLTASTEVAKSFSVEALANLAVDLAARKTRVCPTLVRWRGLAIAPDATTRRDRRLAYILKPVRTSWLPANYAPLANLKTDDFFALRLFVEHAKSVVRGLHAAGVGIVAGTGTDLTAPNVLPGFSLADELAVLVDAGFTPREALATATVEPVAALGRGRELGSIATGKLADLVLLEADPLFAIANVKRVRAVVLAGTMFDRGDLDDQLAISVAVE